MDEGGLEAMCWEARDCASDTTPGGLLIDTVLLSSEPDSRSEDRSQVVSIFDL